MVEGSFLAAALVAKGAGAAAGWTFAGAAGAGAGGGGAFEGADSLSMHAPSSAATIRMQAVFIHAPPEGKRENAPRRTRCGVFSIPTNLSKL
jgi:hypothetical protein